jgi:hypothetical protein
LLSYFRTVAFIAQTFKVQSLLDVPTKNMANAIYVTEMKSIFIIIRCFVILSVLSASAARASSVPSFTIHYDAWNSSGGGANSNQSFSNASKVGIAQDYMQRADTTTGRSSIVVTNSIGPAVSLADLSGNVLLLEDSANSNLMSLFGFASTSQSGDDIFPALGKASGGESGSYDDVPVDSVQEPQTYAMLLAGLGLILFTARRRINNGRFGKLSEGRI